LPDINDESEKSPELTGGIESVDIRTMPYTKTSNGYTKITFKTVPNVLLKTQKALYIPEKESTEKDSNYEKKEIVGELNSIETENNDYNNKNTERTNIQTPQKRIIQEQNQYQPNERNLSSETPKNDNIVTPERQKTTTSDTANDTFEIMMIIMGALLVIVSSVYWFLKHSNKVAEIIGEQPNFDIDDEPEKISEKVKERIENKKKIKKTIQTLDKMYKSPLVMPTKPDIGINDTQKESANDKKQPQEDSVIVDLDELFQEVSQQENENDSLDDFLNEYYNAENEEKKLQAEKEEQEKYNEELFNKFINSDSIKFTKADIAKIDKLLKTELSDELLEAVENLEKESSLDSEQKFNISRIDEVITEYTVNQNITFTKEDVDALDRLMNVELDKNFVTDLRTDHKRTEEMTWEILNRDVKKHNTREIITLRVKDILPDLTKELEIHGKNIIESNAKPEVIYADDGYEVSTLEIDNELLKDNEEPADTNKLQPKKEEEHYDYNVLTLGPDANLPDMEDVRKNPQKYEENKEVKKVDEEKLLRSIENVKFTPIDNSNGAKELTEKPKNDIKTTEPIKKSEKLQIKRQEIKKEIKHQKKDELNAQKLLEMIEQKKEQHRIIREELNRKINETKIAKKETASSTSIPKECVVDDVKYQILACSSFDNHVGCYLATSEQEGYSILGFMGDKIFKIKHYEKIDNSKLQTRISEKLNNGSIRYIVRIGIHKFILDVNDDKMEYVMDLC